MAVRRRGGRPGGDDDDGGAGGAGGAGADEDGEPATIELGRFDGGSKGELEPYPSVLRSRSFWCDGPEGGEAMSGRVCGGTCMQAACWDRTAKTEMKESCTYLLQWWAPLHCPELCFVVAGVVGRICAFSASEGRKSRPPQPWTCTDHVLRVEPIWTRYCTAHALLGTTIRTRRPKKLSPCRRRYLMSGRLLRPRPITHPCPRTRSLPLAHSCC